MRGYKATTKYRAVDHDSYNWEFKVGRTKWHLSFHVKHAYGDGGFWLGLRPEIEVKRDADRVLALRDRARQMSLKYQCRKCGREEWGPPGLGHPNGWDFIHRMDYCGACVRRYTYQELLA